MAVADRWGALYSIPYFLSPPRLAMGAAPGAMVMGRSHGAIVNWAGHKYGYQNFDNGDRSRTRCLGRADDGRAVQNTTTSTR